MITLITAVPGSGKTLSLIDMIVKALESGRTVFTNINGLVVDKFPNNHLLCEAPDDWRDTPEGSLVIYDEAQQQHLYPSNAQRGPVTDQRLTAMETHRHTGHDLVFVTQAPSFVHHHIRKLVGCHVHFYRARGVQGASRYEWSHTCDSPNDRKEQERADFTIWKFPKEYFPYYTSAVVHTHKFKLPFKILVVFLFIGLAVVFLGYRFFVHGGLQTFDSASSSLPVVAQASVMPLPATSLPYEWSSQPEAVPVSGCVASESRGWCQCYGSNGATLSMSHAQCMSVLSSPLPRQFSFPKSGG